MKPLSSVLERVVVLPLTQYCKMEAKVCCPTVGAV